MKLYNCKGARRAIRRMSRTEYQQRRWLRNHPHALRRFNFNNIVPRDAAVAFAATFPGRELVCLTITTPTATSCA